MIKDVKLSFSIYNIKQTTNVNARLWKRSVRTPIIVKLQRAGLIFFLCKRRIETTNKYRPIHIERVFNKQNRIKMLKATDHCHWIVRSSIGRYGFCLTILSVNWISTICRLVFVSTVYIYKFAMHWKVHIDALGKCCCLKTGMKIYLGHSIKNIRYERVNSATHLLPAHCYGSSDV